MSKVKIPIEDEAFLVGIVIGYILGLTVTLAIIKLL